MKKPLLIASLAMLAFISTAHAQDNTGAGEINTYSAEQVERAIEFLNSERGACYSIFGGGAASCQDGLTRQQCLSVLGRQHAPGLTCQQIFG